MRPGSESGGWILLGIIGGKLNDGGMFGGGGKLTGDNSGKRKNVLWKLLSRGYVRGVQDWSCGRARGATRVFEGVLAVEVILLRLPGRQPRTEGAVMKT